MTTCLADERRKARKPHRCNLCYRMIDPGETYTHARYVDGGEIWTWRECPHCSAFVSIINYEYDFMDWWDEGYTTDDISEWAQELRGTKHVRAMRLYAQWRRDWRRGDGTLYPIPEVVKP